MGKLTKAQRRTFLVLMILLTLLAFLTGLATFALLSFTTQNDWLAVGMGAFAVVFLTLGWGSQVRRTALEATTDE